MHCHKNITEVNRFLIDYLCILEVITDQCSAFDLIMKIEVLVAGIELDFFSLDNWTSQHLGLQYQYPYIYIRQH